MRYHLDKLSDLHALEQKLNETLRRRIPERLKGTRQKLAIDLNLIPYYGTPSEEEAPYSLGSRAKTGTNSFYAYATVHVLSRGKRITLAMHAVR